MRTGISSHTIFVNLEDNFTKFWDGVPTGVNRQDQKDFSSGGTHGGKFGIIGQISTFW